MRTRLSFAAIFAALALSMAATSAMIGTPATDAIATGGPAAPPGPPALPDTNVVFVTGQAGQPTTPAAADGGFIELLPFATQDAEVTLLGDGTPRVGSR